MFISYVDEFIVSAQLLTVKFYVDFAWFRFYEHVVSSIPDRDFSCSIFTLRNSAFERAVFHSVVFHSNCESFYPRFERNSFRDSPGSKNAIHLEAKVEMVPTTQVRLEDRRAEQMVRLMDAFEDHDDVQNIWANFDIDTKLLEVG